MSISVKCHQCSRSYSVKDENAGKKFRCQECQAVVTVPEANTFAADDWDAGDTDEDFGSATQEDYEDYEDYGDDEPAAPLLRRAPKKKKPAARKTKPKKAALSKSASETGPMIAKIGVGLLAGVIAFNIAFKLTSGGFGSGANWQSYTTPDGNLTMQMPGKPKPMTVKVMAPGGESLGAETRNFACNIVIEPMPPELNGLSEDEMLNAMQLGGQFLGATNLERSTLNGHPCVSFDHPGKDGVKAVGKAVMHKNKVYTLNFAYKGNQDSERDKFFNSIQFN